MLRLIPLLLLGCLSPNDFECADHEACPSGWYCGLERRCAQGPRPDRQATVDGASGGLDATPEDALIRNDGGPQPDQSPRDQAMPDLDRATADVDQLIVPRDEQLPDVEVDAEMDALPEDSDVHSPEVVPPPFPPTWGPTAWIPGGLYRRDGRNHQVAGFFMDWHEVTVDAYEACVAEARCTARRIDVAECTRLPGQAEHPANCVTLDQALAFCERWGGHLPSEVQWEKAARGGCECEGEPSCEAGIDERTYPWGNQAPDCDRARYNGSCPAGIAPFGSHPTGAGPYGHRDLAGNLAEFTRDCFDETINADAPPPLRPPACPQVVVRGGYFGSSEPELRVTYREARSTIEQVEVGFRCVYDGGD